MIKKVRKAVIPVAGLGTRCLPASKAVPKELLPVVDRPVVQYALDEALAAGIEHVVFVTGRNKGAIEDYFDRAPELDDTLLAAGKHALAAAVKATVAPAGGVSFTRQQAPLGLGHAIWCARDIIGDEPFAILLPDMVSFGARGCLAETIDLYAATGGNIIAVEQCDPAETRKYGIVGKGDASGSGFQITTLVEKPNPDVAPSNYYINGRYVLQPEIFGLLADQSKGAGGEIQLTDAMLRLLADQPFYAQPFSGRMFDCGSKEGLLEATIAHAYARDDVREALLGAVRSVIPVERTAIPIARAS